MKQSGSRAEHSMGRVRTKDAAQQRRDSLGFLEGEGGKKPGTTGNPQADGALQVRRPSTVQLLAIANSSPLP